MVHLCRADDRRGDLCEQPGQGDLCHRNAAFFRQLGDAIDDDLILRSGSVIFEAGVAVLCETLRRFAGMLGKTTAGQGAVRRHGDVFFGAKLGHFALLLAEDEVVMILHADKFREAFLFSEGVRLRKLIGVAVRDADVAHLAGADNIIQPFHDLVEGRRVVPHVIDVEIDVVHAEIAQAGVHHLFDVLLAAYAGRDLLRRAWEKFCRDDNLVAFCEIAQRTAEVSLARPALIADGCVKKIDAAVEPVFHDLARRGFIDGPAVLSVFSIAEAHTAHTDARDSEITITKFRVFHREHPFCYVLFILPQKARQRRRADPLRQSSARTRPFSQTASRSGDRRCGKSRFPCW